MNDLSADQRPTQFSLLSLFVSMTVLGVGLGIVLAIAPRFEELRENYGWVALAAALVASSMIWQWRRAAAGRAVVGGRLAHVALCLYLPFSWVLFLKPWTNDYHFLWLRLWAILPGFVPGFLLFHPRDTPEFATMAIATLLLLAALTWASGRGRYGLLGATVIGLLSSTFASALAYAAFRA